MFFDYGEKEIKYLSERDGRLGNAIRRMGHISREIETDLFAGLVFQIAGQQISGTALKTIWGRLEVAAGGKVTAEKICTLTAESLAAVGLSGRKAGYIKDLALKVSDGTFDLAGLSELDDSEIKTRLCALNGVGEWTAEMFMIFCLCRPDVISFGDFGIRRGMCILYGYDRLDRKTFESHRQVYSPYATVASFYLWAISSGALG